MTDRDVQVDPSTAGLLFETRASDSPWISSVWTCSSESIHQMTSVASQTWGLVFWERDGRPAAAITGPETRTATADVPEGASFTGVQFAVGTSLRTVRNASLLDSGVELSDVTRRSFWLDGGHWQTPASDDAEALVGRWVREGLLVRDPMVVAARRGDRSNVSNRTLERRFRAATGLTRGAIEQIERVRTAAELLAAGERAADVVDKLHFYDEPHLARALRRLVGRTAKQLRDGRIGAVALDLDQRVTS